MRLEKNNEYDVYIESFGYSGEGVCKIENFTIFVTGAIKGERVTIKLLKVNKNFGFGKIVKIIEESKYRVTSDCDIYNSCGGCDLRHISYSGQLEFKMQRVEDALVRIGKCKDITIHEIEASENPNRYRNKVIFPASKNGLGFYKNRTHELVLIESCLLEFKEADIIANLFKELITKYNIEIYDEKKHNSVGLRNVMIRKGFNTGEIMVCLVVKNSLKNTDDIVNELKKLEYIKSIVMNINNKNTNVVLGDKNILLYGNEYIVDNLMNFKFKISPNSFYQVNSVMTEKLYKKILELANLNGRQNIIDAYCGIGTISLCLAKNANKVIGIEIVENAIENAKENASLNSIYNTEFLLGAAETLVPQILKDNNVDLLVLDPPRKGCEIKLLNAIGESNVKKIIYVSCDVATLSRDISILREYGFEAKDAFPFDMFPYTPHVETLVLIQR